MYTLAQTSTPIGSEIFSLVALLIISLVVLLILRHYLPLRTTPAYLLVPIFFSLFLPASIVLLVPIDLASSAKAEDADSRGIWLPERPLLVSWRISYWLTFALAWFILPILAEYSDAGYRDLESRLMYSLRSNAKYQAIVFGSGILAGVYVFLTAGIKVESLRGLVMALAYCWGLILAIYLMGHGLVSIPRQLFRNASISGRLRRIQKQATKTHERMEEAINKLEDIEAEVAELSKRKPRTTAVFKEWIEELEDVASLPESQPRTLTRRMSAPHVKTVAVITEGYMADVSRRLDRARHSRIRFVDEWDRLLAEAADTQMILDSAGSKRLEIGASSPQASLLERFTFFTPYTRYLYYSHVVPYFRIGLGAILSLASVCIIWSELVKVAYPSLSVIALTVVHHELSESADRGAIGFPGQVIAAAWICYMCTAALNSLTEVRVWRGRALVRRNTAPESAFWYAMQVTKLSVPLSYNFMTFLGPKVYGSTTFYNFLGQLINLTPLGEWFDYLFPVFILVPVCATLFNLYGRVKNLLGFGIIDDEDEEETFAGYGTGGWREGRDLIERELNPGSAPGHTLGGLRNGATDSAGPRPKYSATPSERYVASSSNPLRQSAASNVSTASVRASTAKEPEEENFFEGFAHRFRNTMDTVQKPKWMEDGIKKPKWMGGNDENGGSSGGGNSSSDNGNPFTRMFGGSGDGRVRL